MTPTAWADLPNAKHIDRILADLKKNPDRWYATRNAASDAARDDAWYAALLALIAYDDCAYLLDEKPEHVQILALLGNQVAILLYPACIALQKEYQI